MQIEVGADGRPIAYLSPPDSPSGATGKPEDDKGQAQISQPTLNPQPTVSTQCSHINARRRPNRRSPDGGGRPPPVRNSLW